MEPRFATRFKGMKSSIIREILKLTAQPGVISFAGGLPAPELFPLTQLKQAHMTLFDKGDSAVLQYSTTEGDPSLRSWIAQKMNRQGSKVTDSNILILSGSQQGLDLMGKIMLDPGDYVVVENPSYLGAIQCFGAYEAQFLAVESDAQGMDLDHLEELLKQYHPKLIYVIPTFMNPTGITMIRERRQRLAEIAARYQVLVIEDNPYGDLRYSGDDIPPLKAFDEAGWVVYLGSFSKTAVPGMRLGWVAADPQVIAALAQAKQGADLHTATFAQAALSEYLHQHNPEAHVERIKKAYKERRDLMLACMEKHFPKELKWNRPDGGMFIWVTCPEKVDTVELLKKAVEQKVAYVPGISFFPFEDHNNCLRLNFSNASNTQIEEGICRLGQVFHAACK